MTVLQGHFKIGSLENNAMLLKLEQFPHEILAMNPFNLLSNLMPYE